MTGSNPTRQLTIGLIMTLASFPLAFPFIFRIFSVILFFGGLAIYSDGLMQNRQLEKAKKQGISSS